jgi:hypothetical protein
MVNPAQGDNYEAEAESASAVCETWRESCYEALAWIMANPAPGDNYEAEAERASMVRETWRGTNKKPPARG